MGLLTIIEIMVLNQLVGAETNQQINRFDHVVGMFGFDLAIESLGIKQPSK